MTRQQTRNPAPAPTREVVVFDPVEAGRELVREVNARKPQLAALLGIEPESERGKAMLERFVTVALHAATSRPDIMRATRESLIESIRDAAMLGLEPVGATGDGSIVVYDEKVKKERPSPSGRGMIVVEERIPTAHFQPMYRGLLKLARRSGTIEHIDAHVVYEGDEIEIDLGSEPSVSHFPVLDGAKRGGYVGAYAVAVVNGRKYVDWMTVADIEVSRKSSRARGDSAWTAHWPEMARKTVLRRLMKRLPLETLAEHALRIENEAEERSVSPVAVVSETSAARRRLRDRFAPATVPAIAAGDQGGEGSDADASSEADEDAAEGDAAVSVDPSGADPAGDVVEAKARDDDGLCGSESDPKLGEVETCALARGHLDDPKAPKRHQSAAGTVWPEGGTK